MFPLPADKFTWIDFIKVASGPLAAILVLNFLDLTPGEPAPTRMLAVVLWMAFWWILHAIPLGITALLPIVLYPFFGILTAEEVAPHYMNHIIFLFIGGFIVAYAMEKWNLHKRIALRIIMFTGYTPSRILMGFMLSGWFLSMWISNSATTLMLIAPALAVIFKLEELSGKEKVSKYSIGLLLGVAYSCSIGGVATLVGSPPNLIFLGLYTQFFPGSPEISFINWFMFGMPVSVIFLSIVYQYLKRYYCNFNFPESVNASIFEHEYSLLGKMSFEEKVVFSAFILLALLWFTRAGLDLGFVSIPGWGSLFSFGNYILDSTVAVLVAMLLFLIPSKNEPGRKVASWNEAKKIPFEVILLFGGGFALAFGFNASGLAQYIAGNLEFMHVLPLIILVLFICLAMTFLTEFSSNTATTQLILPVLIIITLTLNLPPYLLLIPATFSASFAFMMPVATPPNTIIFGSEKIPVKSMIKTGLILNFTGAILITLAILSLGKWVFG